MISLCVIQKDNHHYEITTTDVRDKRPIHIIENAEGYTISVCDSGCVNGPGFLPVTENL
jgi:iron only hydrogenase large subunit-like protein